PTRFYDRYKQTGARVAASRRLRAAQALARAAARNAHGLWQYPRRIPAGLGRRQAQHHRYGHAHADQRLSAAGAGLGRGSDSEFGDSLVSAEADAAGWPTGGAALLGALLPPPPYPPHPPPA